MLRKYFFFAFMLFATSALLTSCDDDDSTPVGNIVEVAQGDDNLSTLVAALTDSRHSTDFVALLSGDGPFTVFAPTNAAFQALLDSNDDWDGLGDIPIATLDAVLRLHVLGGEVRAAGLQDGYYTTQSLGPNGEQITIQVNTASPITFNGSANPITTDIDASNGVIHTIDEVMLPLNVVGIATTNPGFSTLVAALTDSRHTTNFVEVLSGAGPFTVFAPTNAAFQALLDSNNDWNGLGDIPITTLDAVLRYHVVSGANVQSDQLNDDQSVTMLDGGATTIDLSDASAPKIETATQSVNIVGTDVQGSNGVVHVIDAVLIP